MNEYSKITETQYYMNPKNGLINNSFEEQVIYHKWVVAKKIPRNNKIMAKIDPSTVPVKSSKNV